MVRNHSKICFLSSKESQASGVNPSETDHLWLDAASITIFFKSFKQHSLKLRKVNVATEKTPLVLPKRAEHGGFCDILQGSRQEAPHTATSTPSAVLGHELSQSTCTK